MSVSLSLSLSLCMYIYIYIYMCVCVCVCVSKITKLILMVVIGMHSKNFSFILYKKLKVKL